MPRATALKAAGCADDVIQMICRWANPDSLKVYARHGTSLHINWVDRAEKAVVDAIQASSVPKVCNSEGNIAILHHFGGTVPARARHVLDNADRETGDTTAPPPEPPDASPLTRAHFIRRVGDEFGKSMACAPPQREHTSKGPANGTGRVIAARA